MIEPTKFSAKGKDYIQYKKRTRKEMNVLRTYVNKVRW